MMGADLLLLFQGRQFNAQIPAKAYEYIRCGRPVMGLVDGQGQSAAFLASFEATWMAEIGTQWQIEQALLKWMNATSNSQSLQSNNGSTFKVTHVHHRRRDLLRCSTSYRHDIELRTLHRPDLY